MGVFTSLFGSRKKSFSFDCPMCTRTYDVKFNIEDAAECGFYEHSNYYRHVNDAKCEFCKTEMAIVYARDGRKVKAFDEKWQKVERKYNANSEKVQEALDDIEAKIDDEGSTLCQREKESTA